MRVVFMGSSEFAVPALRAIVERGHAIPAVYCQPPRPAGRGLALAPSPVQSAAESFDLTVETPETLGTDESAAVFRAFSPDVGVVASYGMLLPQRILETPIHGCLNIHASLLPRWRGASPIQHAIWRGDSETGVSIMQMDAGLDTGPVVCRQATPIADTDTGGTVHDRLAEIGAELIVESLDRIVTRDWNPRRQDDATATYAPKLSRDDGRLDWARPAVELERQVRAFDPWPGTWAVFGGKRLRVLKANICRLDSGSVGEPGTLLPGNQMIVCCGDGSLLRLLEVQRPGRKTVSDEAFLRGLKERPPVRIR